MKGSLVAGVLFVTLSSSACREVAPEAPSGEPRRSAAAPRESYRPPDDGVLAPAQVDAFLRVREEANRIRRSPAATAPLEGDEGISGATQARAVEVRAARSLSVPVDEYLWVRERILEAEAASLTAKLNADVLALLEKTLASLRERRSAAPDEASRRLLDEQTASFEAEAARVRRETADAEPESIRANLKVLAPFRARLSAIADEMDGLGPVVPPADGPPAR